MATVTKSIGTTARDYSTITLWEADLDNGAVYSAADDAVGECYNDSAFDEGTLVFDGGATLGLNSITLSVASGERHDGTAGVGARNVATANTRWTFSVAVTGLFEWLEMDWVGTYQGAGARVTEASATWSVQRVILHDAVGGDDLIQGTNADILNSILYASTADGIQCLGSATQRILNNTIHGCTGSGIVIVDDADKTYQNNICTDNGTDYSVASPVNATIDYNIASDTTAAGANSHDSEVAADLFVSTTGGSEDLHLKSGATNAIDGGADLGTTPSGVEIDIDGRDRDAQGDTWDIGAHEFVAAATAGGSEGPRPRFMMRVRDPKRRKEFLGRI
jgi:parallel beta-helix repeat protein